MPDTFLAQWLYPLPFSEFDQHYYSHKPVYIKGTNSLRSIIPINIISIAECIMLCELSYADKGDFSYAIFRNGGGVLEPFAIPKKSTSHIDWLQSLNTNHWSLVFNFVEHLSIDLYYLCRQLESELSSETDMNFYYTPAQSRCFNLHADSHDIFIWQLDGRKHWQIYSLDDPNGERDPILSIELLQGEMLYIPQGFPHVAETNSASDSTHLSISFYSRPRKMLLQLQQSMKQWLTNSSMDTSFFIGKKGEALGEFTLDDLYDLWHQFLPSLEQDMIDKDDNKNPNNPLSTFMATDLADVVLCDQEDLSRYEKTAAFQSFLNTPLEQRSGFYNQIASLKNDVQQAMDIVCQKDNFSLDQFDLADDKAIAFRNLLLLRGQIKQLSTLD